jgi:hypothetical protein
MSAVHKISASTFSLLTAPHSEMGVFRGRAALNTQLSTLNFP